MKKIVLQLLLSLACISAFSQGTVIKYARSPFPLVFSSSHGVLSKPAGTPAAKR